jgi:uncharacterized protein (TIGR04255 family)
MLRVRNARSRRLKDYMVDSDQAPITQLMLTVQFFPHIQNLNPIDLADLYAPFRADFPVFEQVPRAGPMPLDVNDTVAEVSFGLAPRYRFVDNRNEFSIFLQNDRFSLNWGRVNALDGPSEYPGFDSILSKAFEFWGGYLQACLSGTSNFLRWLEKLFTQTCSKSKIWTGCHRSIRSLIQILNLR